MAACLEKEAKKVKNETAAHGAKSTGPGEKKKPSEKKARDDLAKGRSSGLRPPLCRQEGEASAPPEPRLERVGRCPFATSKRMRRPNRSLVNSDGRRKRKGLGRQDSERKRLHWD